MLTRTIFLPGEAALDLDVGAAAPQSQVAIPAEVALRLGCPATWRTGVKKEAMPAVNPGVEMGLSTPDFREFFLSKGGATGVLVVRRKEDGTWHAAMSKTNMPAVLSKDAVQNGWLPPLGQSGLPSSLEAVVPQNFQYWKCTDPVAAGAMRNALVDSSLFSEDLIKVVDGDLRLCVQQYFLYEPDPAPVMQKRAPMSKVAEVIDSVIGDRTLEQPHTVASGFAEELRRTLKKSNTLVFCSSPGDSPSAIVDAVLEKGTVAEYMIEADNTPDTIAQFAKIGVPFLLDGMFDRAFVANFDVVDARYIPTSKAEWTSAYVNDLPDGSFLYIEPGGEKDEEGKTKPRSLRHFPVKDKDGNVDHAHVANALARIPQSSVPEEAKTKAKSEAQHMLESLNKAEPPDPVQKPFAGFEDFDACVLEQKKNGHSEESARRICGKLQADTEKTAKQIATLKIRVGKAAPAPQQDEQYVLGEVLVPEDVDAQNDIYSADEVRQTAHKFLEQFRNVGLMHKNIINDKVKILESYIAPVDMDFGGYVVKKGTWMMGVKVLDPELWKAIKGGELTGFSIGGSAIRSPDPNGGTPQNPPTTPA